MLQTTTKVGQPQHVERTYERHTVTKDGNFCIPNVTVQMIFTKTFISSMVEKKEPEALASC